MAEKNSDGAAAAVDGVDARHVTQLFNSEINGMDGKRYSFLSATLETFGMRGGHDKKDDVYGSSLDHAMMMLRSMVEPKRQTNSHGGAWNFSLTPLQDFDATQDDLLQAFVMWSRKQQADESCATTSSTTIPSEPEPSYTYNVSKAFRRLEAYVEWMDQNARQVDFTNGMSMKHIAPVWDMKMTHDKYGRLVWFCDLEALDFDYIKHKLPHDDTLRYLVWLAHLILFDKGTQQHGVVLVYSIGKVGFMESLTLVPLELQHKFDSLSIGRLPIRVESIIFVNNPTWIKIVLTLVKPFLSWKMTRRLKLIPNKEDPRDYLESALGSDCFPVNMMSHQLQGTLEVDLISERFNILTARCTPC